VECLVQRAEDRADAEEALFPDLPALPARVRGGPELSGALGAAIAGRAFKTEQYTTDWGFFEWASHITDWSRDLFVGGNAAETDFAVSARGALDVVSFDGMSTNDLNDARATMTKSHPGMMWLPIIGLDRHTPMIGLRVLRDPTAAAVSSSGHAQIQEAIYRPISDFITAG
jgi:hypothetical protein